METTIYDAEIIGIYPEEIYIVSKHEPSISVPRDKFKQVTIENVERVIDSFAGMERRISISLETGSVCLIDEPKIYCGKEPRPI